MLSFVNSVTLEVAPPASLAVGSPARSEALLRQVPSPASVASSGLSPSSLVSRSAPDVSPPSGLAAMDQELPWSALLLLGVSDGRVVWLSLGRLCLPRPGIPIWLGATRRCPTCLWRASVASSVSPRVLEGIRGCQYRMTSYDQESGGPDFSPAYGIQLHDPRLLEYVGEPESAQLLSRSPEYWLHHLGHEKTLAVALQLQHDAGLILSKVQVLQQFVTSLNRTSSEVTRVAFGRAPVDAIQKVMPSYPGPSGGSLYGGHGFVAAA